MTKYEIFMTSDNEDGVLASVCNMMSARGFSIESISAEPLNAEKSLSFIKLRAMLPEEKIANIYEKLLQIVAIREVKIYKIDRVF